MDGLKEQVVNRSSVYVSMHTDSIELSPEELESLNKYDESHPNVTYQGPPLEYDETDDTSSNSGWCGSLSWFMHEFVLDNTPAFTFLLYFVLFSLGMCFGPLTLPLLKRIRPDRVNIIPGNMLREIKSVDTVGANLSHFRSILNALCFLFTTMGVMFITLIIVLCLRYISIKLIVQPLYHITYLAVIATYAMDPAASYCVWTICNYVLIRKYINPVFEDNNGSSILFYRFVGFGNNMQSWYEIDPRCYTLTNSIFQLLILMALRKLVLSSLLFFFEVTFLPNYSGELVSYLKEQALLRKFNIAWMNLMNCARKSDHYAVIEAVNSANRSIEQLPRPETPITYNHRVYYDSSHFTIFRQPIKSGRMLQRKNDMKVKAELPQFCKERWIEKSMSNMLTNWTALHQMVHNPPELLFPDFYVPLVSKKTVQEYSRLLFDHIYETMSALGHPHITEAMGEEIRKLHSARSTMENVPNTSRSSGRRSERASLQPTVVQKSSKKSSTAKASSEDGDSGDESNHAHADAPLDPIATERDEMRVITRRMFTLLQPAVVDDFFNTFDTGNCGSVTSNIFTKNVLYMCSLRKRLISALKNQRSILSLVNRLLSTALWFLLCVLYLMTLRVNKNIVLPSVIGFMSAMIVALSYMYNSFITAIIFVVLSNPYNVGDRVRINDGEAMYVSSISTYNTVFRCIHEKIVIYQNAQLSSMKIANETRARHAIMEVTLCISGSTTPAAQKQLIENVKSFVNHQPRVYVHNGCFVYVSQIQISHFYNLKFLITFMDNWLSPGHIFILQKGLLSYILKQCGMLGITYRAPMKPVILSGNFPFKGSLDNVQGALQLPAVMEIPNA